MPSSGLINGTPFLSVACKGITDSVMFHAETRKGLPQAMKDAVNSYLESCRNLGEVPQKPNSVMPAKQKPLQEQKDAVLAWLRAGQTPEEREEKVVPEKFARLKAKVEAFYNGAETHSDDCLTDASDQEASK